MHHNVPHAAPEDATTARGNPSLSVLVCDLERRMISVLEALRHRLNGMIYYVTVIVINAPVARGRCETRLRENIYNSI